jgi:hypothetical protein
MTYSANTRPSNESSSRQHKPEAATKVQKAHPIHTPSSRVQPHAAGSRNQISKAKHGREEIHIHTSSNLITCQHHPSYIHTTIFSSTTPYIHPSTPSFRRSLCNILQMYSTPSLPLSPLLPLIPLPILESNHLLIDLGKDTVRRLVIILGMNHREVGTGG